MTPFVGMEAIWQDAQKASAERELKWEEVTSSLYHFPEWAMLDLRAQWEAFRFEQLQKPKNQERVEGRREKIQELHDDLAAEEHLLQERIYAWRTQTEEALDAFNDDLQELTGNRLAWKDKTFDSLLSTVEVTMEALKEQMKMIEKHGTHVAQQSENVAGELQSYEQIHTNTGEAIKRLKLFKRDLIVSWGEDVTKLGTEETIPDIAHRITKKRAKLEKALKSEGTPEAIAMRRQQLVAERDALLESVDHAKLRIEMYRRKLNEKKSAIKELLAGNDPRIAQEQRERAGIEVFLDQLAGYESLAVRFETPEMVRLSTEHAETVRDLGDRPLAIDLERILERTPVPNDLRLTLEQSFGERYEPVTLDQVRGLRNIVLGYVHYTYTEPDTQTPDELTEAA